MIRTRLEYNQGNMIGRCLTHFRILEKLGQGGMGVVYEALDTSLNRQVALKILPTEYMTDPERKRRFIQEAQSASALNHPHIVTIYEISSADGMDFIAMELIRGQPLNKLIEGRGLEPARALKYAIQIAEALSTAHEHGIIHRDLKPNNVMITEQDDVKLVDFGLAKLVETAGIINLSEHPTIELPTQPGIVLGTPNYMSPEQAEGKPVDLRSDIFSFGSVLFEMLTGRCPFTGDTPARILSSILRDEPHVPDEKKDVPQELRRIVAKALEKEREYRYQHMQDALADLKKLQHDVTSGATSAVGSSRRRTPAVIAVLVVLMAGIGILLWRWWPRQAEMPQTRVSPISGFPGSHRAASFSPDGSMVAFEEAYGGKSRIFIKNLAQGDPIPITAESTSAERPRWSPKNDEIVFCTGRFDPSGNQESIWTTPPLGGTSRQIIAGGRNPNWSWDGNKLVFERRDEIWVAHPNGTGQHRVDGVQKVPLLLADRYPAFSPDGTQIAYFQSELGPRGDYWVIPADGGQPIRLTFDRSEGGAPVWTPDGQFLIAPSARSGSTTLWRMPVSGGRPDPLTTGAGEDTDPELSRDGRRLVFTNAKDTYRLQLLDAVTGMSHQLVQAQWPIVAPMYSPDGARIAYFFRYALYVVGIHDARPTQVVVEKGREEEFPRWSPDGSALYYYQIFPVPAFRKLSLDGGQTSDVVPGWTWQTEYGANVDPADKLIVYVTRSRGKPTATLIRDMASGGERALPYALDDPRWSRDGKSIAGYDSDNNILVCPADGGPCRRITNGINPVWSASDSRLFFLRKGTVEDGSELWSISVDGKGEEKITDLRPMRSIAYFYDVSSQDQIAWVQFQPGARELWLLEFTQ